MFSLEFGIPKNWGCLDQRFFQTQQKLGLLQLDTDTGLPFGSLFCLVPEGWDLASCQHLSHLRPASGACWKGSTDGEVVQLMPPDHVQRPFYSDLFEENNTQFISLFFFFF